MRATEASRVTVVQRSHSLHRHGQFLTDPLLLISSIGHAVCVTKNHCTVSFDRDSVSIHSVCEVQRSAGSRQVSAQLPEGRGILHHKPEHHEISSAAVWFPGFAAQPESAPTSASRISKESLPAVPIVPASLISSTCDKVPTSLPCSSWSAMRDSAIMPGLQTVETNDGCMRFSQPGIRWNNGRPE